MEVTKEELDRFIEHLWQEEVDRRIENNGVLKELYEEHKKGNEQ